MFPKPSALAARPSRRALYVRYDFSSLRGRHLLDVVDAEAPGWQGMWRYRAVLPDVKPVTLSEGWTPMLHSRRYQCASLKEQGANVQRYILGAPEHEDSPENRSGDCRRRRART